ncbi:MAG TPA: hypothetical protein QF564_02950 [Pirellulaceae bacterium]|jgi:hypothetical protein|nr:hypothetical protein [Pirellulaceae bacterium]
MSTLAEQMADDTLEAQTFSRKHLVVELGMSASSVAELEENIDMVEFAIAGGKSDENVELLTRLWGAYLGEVLIHASGGSWIEKDGRPAVQGANGIAFPHDQIRRRMIAGSENNLATYFAEMIKQL